ATNTTTHSTSSQTERHTLKVSRDKGGGKITKKGNGKRPRRPRAGGAAARAGARLSGHSLTTPVLCASLHCSLICDEPLRCPMSPHQTNYKHLSSSREPLRDGSSAVGVCVCALPLPAVSHPAASSRL
ncbi:MAG: hypothetical protein MHM6MM_007415, partial [Cercozoa sp. M6MM]